MLNISPGPDVAYVVGRTLSQGRMVGFLSVLGVCSGAMLHSIAAGLGFSVIIQTSELAYHIVLYLGAAYLLYLGIKTLLSKEVVTPKTGAVQVSKPKIYLQAVLVDVLNPKVALFFLAFVPQFIHPDDPHRLLTFVTLGGVVVGIALIWENMLVFATDFLFSRFLAKPVVTRVINVSLGLLFIGLAVKLAFF